jgi:ATP-dependent exoDNAse (exonuclease V) beta subunit
VSIEIARFELQVRIDRIDELGDGSLAILDYKTSERGTPNDWLRDRPRDVQLPLYACHAAARVSAAAIAAVTADAKYRGIGLTARSRIGPRGSVNTTGRRSSRAGALKSRSSCASTRPAIRGCSSMTSRMPGAIRASDSRRRTACVRARLAGAVVSAADDRAARAAALDPTRSFIVQAPAGSGKTELLIQRYLALLATVDEPEQVVAITFTRKAAAEMRGRVRRALESAAAGEKGDSPHREATLALARTAVARDVERDWALLAQPRRLRIDTLDAFNAWLARQLPVLADGVAAATIVDDARDFYRAAARNIVAAVGSDGELGDCVRVLATVFDDLAQLEELLADLLARREQWLERFVGADASALRPLLEDALRRLVDDELGALAPLTEPAVLVELRLALRQVASHATSEKLRAATTPWLQAGMALPLKHGSLREWQGAASLLLTQEGEWRKQLTKREGFGKEHGAARERCERLFAHLRGDPDLLAALVAVRKLPEPRYTDAQWRQLEALRVVLLHLAAELKSSSPSATHRLRRARLAARRALGRVDAPSELLLALDRRIQHLLVDEFQDTSQSQVRLLELLTAGWERGDGRTLFLVGDPMQSIYRSATRICRCFSQRNRAASATFRSSTGAQRNFRSAPAIVSWVNATFTHVFPKVDQIAAGAAAFRESVAARAAAAETAVHLHGSLSAEPRDESARVDELIADELERDPEQSIAVLVQARGHLAGTARAPKSSRRAGARGRDRRARRAARRAGLARARTGPRASRRPDRLARGAARAVVRTHVG